MGMVVAIAGSFALLVTRLIRRSTLASDRIASRLMMAGIGLAFGPGLFAFILPLLIGATAGTTLGLFISLIAVPLLPFFYTYAIYKHQLGPLEFRVSRLLSLYSFILIYPTIFIVVLLFFEQWITNAAARTVYLLALSIVFVLAGPPFLNRFRDFVNRLAYGTEHDPDDLLRVFAQQIPSALKREALVELLTKQITPALLIRQSALCLFESNDATCLYGLDLSSPTDSVSLAQLRDLLPGVGLYQPPSDADTSTLGWVRLSIALITREQTIGIWLFGRRDPDDFYPQKDIELLETLANQIAPVIENIRLYEELQVQADQLAEDVANRTVELREERDRTQAILDSAAEGIFFTDPVGAILYINHTMGQISGYSAEELRNRTLDLWETEDGSDETYRQIWIAIRRGQHWAGEVLLRCKDGSRRDVSLSIAPIQSQNGELSGFVGVQSDISKLKEVDRLKSSIISSVSHELKTPLTTIKTYLMLLERGKPEKRDNYLMVLNKESDRLKNIIEDLLDLSALDTGEIPSKLEQVNIHAAINDVILSNHARSAIKEIDLRADLPEYLPNAIVDNNQLDQVLANLVVNALNYTPQGGRVVLSGGPGQLDGAPAIWLSVSDNGPGITSQDMSQLFDRFFRGQAAVESNAPGTGLGLSICKEIVDRHHGRIDVSSVPGEGATFTVWFHAKGVMPRVSAEDNLTSSLRPETTEE
jgi:two-component system phosphate regulon sensor histidine kinase PhoR